MMKKRGFTLAEVLIALGVVGVLAAITTPMLMTATAKSQVETGLAKSVAIWEQANIGALKDADSSNIFDAWGQSDGTLNYEEYSKALSNQMKMSSKLIEENQETSFVNKLLPSAYAVESNKERACQMEYCPDGLNNCSFKNKQLMMDCIARLDDAQKDNKDLLNENNQGGGNSEDDDDEENENPGTDPDTDSGSDTGSDTGSASDSSNEITLPDWINMFNQKNRVLVANNGITFAFVESQKDLTTSKTPNKQRIGFVAVDINGVNKGKNQVAKDIFGFALYNDGSLRPIGGANWDGKNDEKTKTWRDTCANDSQKKDISCTASIIEQGYKIKYKY